LGSEWSRVAAFAAAVDTTLGKWLVDAHRVGLTDYRALVHLAQAPDKELRVNDLALRLGLNQSSTTRLVHRLEAKGLARRDTCPDDARGVYAVVTRQGEDLVAEVRGPYEARIRELLGDVTSHSPQLDPEQLTRTLGSVSDLVSA
jgi:DNA-binding MarR family transcriptional regulator